MLTFILLLFLRADNKETGRSVRCIMSNNAREAALEEQQGRRILPARRVKRQAAQEGGKMFKVALRGVSRPFFAGTTFKLSGFPMQRQTELSVWIVEAEGEIVLLPCSRCRARTVLYPCTCKQVEIFTGGLIGTNIICNYKFYFLNIKYFLGSLLREGLPEETLGDKTSIQ